MLGGAARRHEHEARDQTLHLSLQPLLRLGLRLRGLSLWRQVRVRAELRVPASLLEVTRTYERARVRLGPFSV
jgi:hypothetical protein